YLPNEAYFSDRAGTGATTTSQTGGVTTPAYPTWMKLVRSGSTFTAFNSADGFNWTQVGSSITLTMAANTYVGLAVSSGSNSTPVTVSFDNVSITSAAQPQPSITGISAT